MIIDDIADAAAIGRFDLVEKACRKIAADGSLTADQGMLWIRAGLAQKRPWSVLVEIATQTSQMADGLASSANLSELRRAAVAAFDAHDWQGAARCLAVLCVIGDSRDLCLTASLIWRTPDLAELLAGAIDTRAAGEGLEGLGGLIAGRLDQSAQTLRSRSKPEVADVLDRAASRAVSASGETKDCAVLEPWRIEVLMTGVTTAVVEAAARCGDLAADLGISDQLVAQFNRDHPGAVATPPVTGGGPAAAIFTSVGAMARNDVATARRAAWAARGAGPASAQLLDVLGFRTVSAHAQKAGGKRPRLLVVEPKGRADPELLAGQTWDAVLAREFIDAGAAAMLDWRSHGAPGVLDLCREEARRLARSIFDLAAEETRDRTFVASLERALFHELGARMVAATNAFEAVSSRDWEGVDIVAANPEWARLVSGHLLLQGVREVRVAAGTDDIRRIRRFWGRYGGETPPRLERVDPSVAFRGARAELPRPITVLTTQNRPDLTAGLSDLVAGLAQRAPVDVIAVDIGRDGTTGIEDFADYAREAASPVRLLPLQAGALWRDHGFDVTPFGVALEAFAQSESLTVGDVRADPLIAPLCRRALGALRGFRSVGDFMTAYVETCRPRFVLALPSRSPATDASLVALGRAGCRSLSLQAVQTPISSGLHLPPTDDHLVIDEEAADDYRRLGAAADRVHVVGTIRSGRSEFHRAPSAEPSILVISQPLGTSSVRALVEAAATAAAHWGNVKVVLKLHPSEPGAAAAHWRAWLDARSFDAVTVVDGREPVDPLLASSVTVLTHNSNVGIQAAMADIPVITIGERAEGDLCLSRLGAASAAADAREAARLLQKVISGMEPPEMIARRRAFQDAHPTLAAGGVDRVLAAIDALFFEGPE